MSNEHVRDAVLRAVATIARRSGYGGEIHEDLSIVYTLGLDSLRMVDLTVELEEQLTIREFPMQAWADHEAERGEDTRFTVRSLIASAEYVVSHERGERVRNHSARA